MMGMAARGHEALEQAKVQLIRAKTVEQLRQAQAVILPLSYGLSLEQTADILGISVSWACKLRTRFARGEVANPEAKREHRPRQNMSIEPKKRSCPCTNEQQVSQAMTLVTLRGVTQWVNRN